ncbi:MAG: hypothetical protein CSB55_01340 [Candidatus Cloacimonadota bacterium]|nr:MAG: hypothetical protein CSB55_01340 [Candidatus Cloacimonadota bacterium]
MNTEKLILFSFLLISSLLHAGRYAGDFMMIGAGVRPLSMGGAYVATAEGVEAIYWNPAGLSQKKSAEIALMRAFLYEDLASYDFMGYVQPLPNNVTVGISWTRLSIDKIPEFSEKWLVGTNIDERILNSDLHLPGVPDGYFSGTDDLFQFGFSKYIRKDVDMGWLFFEIPVDFYFGSNVKYIKRELYDNVAAGVGIDGSFLTKLPFSELVEVGWFGDLKIGINVQDIGGTVLSWDTESDHEDEILMNTKFGVAYVQPISSLKSKLTLAWDSDYVYKQVNHWGFEYDFRNIFSVRGGYYDKNYSVGLGFEFYKFVLDYGFITNPLGNTNRVGLKYLF